MFIYERTDCTYAAFKQSSIVLNVVIENNPPVPMQMFWNQRFEYLRQTIISVLHIHRTLE